MITDYDDGATGTLTFGGTSVNYTMSNNNVTGSQATFNLGHLWGSVSDLGDQAQAPIDGSIVNFLHDDGPCRRPKFGLLKTLIVRTLETLQTAVFRVLASIAVQQAASEGGY